jgi:hypothetical protein
MARLDQKEEAMRAPKDRPTQRFDGTRGAGISLKLQKVITDIENCGHTNLTRLTVLKKWFETPHRLSSFGIFIALQASRRTRKTTDATADLFREVDETLADVDVFDPNIPRAGATRLHARLEAFQNERRNVHWTSLRVIHNQDLFLVESGLRLYLWHGNSPTEGYRLAANYCENYDPRYGNGLNGPSADRIESIAGFVLAIEAYEDTAHKLSSHKA